MKEEVRRIMQLVKDGKLSPEDAAELVDAFQDSPDGDESETANSAQSEETVDGEAEPGEPYAGHQDSENNPFSKLIGAIEKVGKDVSTSVNWKDLASQIKTGVDKGVESIREAAEEAKKGRGPFGSVFGGQVRKHVDLPLSVPKGKVLRIEAQSGDITIEGGHDVGSVSIDAAFRAYNEEEANSIADRYVPVVEESENAVTLRHPEPANTSADINIKIPAGTDVVVKVASGDIHVKATKAAVKIEGASGNIKVHEAKGVVDIATTSGDVKVTESKTTSTNVETKSGDIILDKVKGAANLRTSSGDVTAYEFAGKTVAIEAASGDVVLDLCEPVSGMVNIRTVSGEVTVHVPDGSDARTTLSTLRGEVTCNLELEDPSIDRMKVTGKLGDGSGSIDISAVNGDVFVGLRDSTATE
ncbi:DUF4097 family beta strand repeat-containing protein [Kamptonema cortianum]|nr:DUF4097 family beta strand repeat-containing protein [Geitlerinema splendidum]MDK3156143.1 DUF4097 family beta strand repeat-containing protein [Kamptonema cortianum]